MTKPNKLMKHLKTSDAGNEDVSKLTINQILTTITNSHFVNLISYALPPIEPCLALFC